MSRSISWTNIGRSSTSGQARYGHSISVSTAILREYGQRRVPRWSGWRARNLTMTMLIEELAADSERARLARLRPEQAGRYLAGDSELLARYRARRKARSCAWTWIRADTCVWGISGRGVLGEEYSAIDPSRTFTRKDGSGDLISRTNHPVEELEVLHDVVERGPDWNTIEEIRVHLNPQRTLYPDDTVEASLRR
jgi:hypothetical protein